MLEKITLIKLYSQSFMSLVNTNFFLIFWGPVGFVMNSTVNGYSQKLSIMKIYKAL